MRGHPINLVVHFTAEKVRSNTCQVFFHLLQVFAELLHPFILVFYRMIDLKELSHGRMVHQFGISCDSSEEASKVPLPVF